jgi:serine/threonine protein kinase
MSEDSPPDERAKPSERATDRITRLSEIGAVLAARMPSVLDAAVALLESIPPALEPSRPERYEITRPIGAGGQAEVLLASVRGAEGFHRRVAVKRVRAGQENAAALVADLIGEALLAAELSHPNVVRVLDVDRDKAGQPFLVMEYVDGIDLGKLIETGPVPHPVASFIVRELLAGLGYIHAPRHHGRGRARRGLVHRDVSPSNVLLSWEGEVKLADFGVAQMLERTMTAPAMAIVGKPGYMSPEQADCLELDGRSDLYAVGIVLWELLSHRRFPAGATDDVTAVFLARAITRPSAYRQDVPADLEAVVMRLLAYDREERYRAAELAAHDLMRCQAMPPDGRGELARFLDERFPRARRQRPSSRSPSVATPSEVRTLTEPSVPVGAPPWPQLNERAAGQRRARLERARRHWRAFAWGVLMALLIAAAIVWLMLVMGCSITQGRRTSNAAENAMSSALTDMIQSKRKAR